MAEQYL